MKDPKVIVPALTFLFCFCFLSSAQDKVIDYAALLPPLIPVEPEDALKTFKIQPGFKIELVAAEPLIADPVEIAFDARGRLWVLEFTQYNQEFHGVMKAEEMLIISDQDAAHYKNWDHALADYYVPPLPDQVNLRHLIDIDETLKQFDDRFLNGEIFRSATEICEMHLIPLRERPVMSSLNIPVPEEGKKIQPRIDQIMESFWENHSPTGDNSRERPYSNIYPRLTTKSNTFRVHSRVQVLKKARDSDHETFTPNKDTVSSEWRGETLLERYIDPNNESIPDYAKSGNVLNKENLDRFYQYRILYQKRFEG